MRVSGDENIIRAEIVDKGWGREEWFVNREYCGKRLYLDRGFSCSMHCHKNKDETFSLGFGEVLAEFENQSGGEQSAYLLKPKNILLIKYEGRILQNPLNFGNSSLLIKPHKYHRFMGLKDSLIIEASTHHEDMDSYRKLDMLSGKIDLNKIMKEYGLR